MNVTLSEEIAERLKKYQRQTNTDSLPQVYRWLIEGAVLYIDTGNVSPIFKVLTEINAEENNG
jgi:hypothetical protein